MEDWLQSNGLDRYIPVFRQHGITPDQLANLTDDDLRELGLTIGDRKRYRAAVLAMAPTTASERRPLTIMFVDLVGSSAHGERLDPEDLMEVIRQYRDRCGIAIARYGGKIARFVGDGIKAYFCYPVANENDPERACRAAMEIVRAIEGFSTPDGEPIQIRIGLATGIVIVGDLIAGGETESLTSLGSTPNLAARLQSLAAPNGIVVAEQTYFRIRRRFECERMTPVQLSGFANVQQPWRILAERTTRGMSSRLLGGSDRAPLVGRESEQDGLRTLWRAAAEGVGCAALIAGEPGIGKTRLAEQFLDDDLPENTELVEITGSAFDIDSPLRPFIDLIRAEAGLSETADNQEAISRLRSILSAPQDEALALLAGLVGLQYSHPAIEQLTPEQLRERTIALLAAHVAGRGKGKPLCILVEDLHWIDPTSCEVLAALARMIAGQRALLLITTREGVDCAWLPKSTTVTFRLSRLSADLTSRLARSLLGERTIPAGLLNQIARRTDGVPLFIEEVTRSLIERVAETARPSIGDEESHIPASLHEALIGRLDRTAGAKLTAQVASVTGRLVRLDVLTAVSGMSPDELERSVTALVAAGVIEQDLSAPVETYTFSHSLLRDAAYGSLLRDRRRELHEKVARALQKLLPEIAVRQPEVLAAHLTDGGQAIEAAPLWLDAARSSLSRSALTEAARLLRRGLSALERMPASVDTLRLRLQLSGSLGAALMGLHGPFAAETQHHYTAAYDLCQELPEDEAHFPIYWGWWRVAPDYRAHLERATSLLERAKARDVSSLMLQAHHCNWAINFHLGALERCCDHMRSGLAIYGSGDYRHHAQLYGNHDAKVCAHGGLCQIYWMQGRLSSAEHEEAAGLAWADRLNHLGSRVHALGLTLLYRTYRRDLNMVLRRANDLLTLTTEYDLKEHQGAATIFLGWVRSLSGEQEQGLKMIEEGFAQQREVASTEDFPVYLCMMAEPLIALGRADEAVERMLAERAALDAIGLRLWMPELLRVTADTMLIASPDAVERAKTLFNEADELAVKQGVHMLRLRLSQSRLLLEKRLATLDVPEAVHRLQETLDAIPEPDASAELIKARQLLRIAAA